MSGIVSFVGAPQSVSGANGGKIYAFNGIVGTNVQVAPANPNRRSIVFHNPGGHPIYVSMTMQMSQNGVASPIVPSIAAPGGTFLIQLGDTLTLAGGETQLAWQAFADGGPGSLTVMDSNA